MFGKNAIAKVVWHGTEVPLDIVAGKQLEVNSIFATIQGEGPHAGSPAIFIRLAGCNLRCHFCDTEFETSRTMTLKEIQLALDEMSIETDLVVLTGGEPMRQQIIPLLQFLDDLGYTTQIETAGTVWPPDAEIDKVTVLGVQLNDRRMRSLESLIASGAVELVCSPKTPSLHPNVVAHCKHFKYIIRKGEVSKVDGLPNYSTQIEGEEATLYRPDFDNAFVKTWVQPCDEHTNQFDTKANMEACVEIAMAHGYRISLQQHKILQVD